MSQPLVSIIALSYNHEKFIEQALASVFQQTYLAIELILVDDASTDRSAAVAQTYLQQHSEALSVKTVFLPQNLGNCAAFNRGLAQAQGKYVVDFATDDILFPQRIARQVAYFESLTPDYGVVFTEAEYVDEDGNHLWFHYQDRLAHIRPIPVGEVYADVVARYFISSPTMMIRKKVLDELEGYDEQLAYEDFDFWVRSARKWKYAYLDECTTRIRKHQRSMSTGWYKPNDPQLYSTYVICQKAIRLNRTNHERKALILRVMYEIKQSIRNKQWRESILFGTLLCRLILQIIKTTLILNRTPSKHKKSGS
ncbi:MAG: glycosyltransferase [Cyclobacteriaceae bacterium]